MEVKIFGRWRVIIKLKEIIKEKRNQWNRWRKLTNR